MVKGAHSSAKQFRQFRAGIVRPHERFADQKGMNALLAHQRHIGWGMHPAFGDDRAVFGNPGQQI